MSKASKFTVSQIESFLKKVNGDLAPVLEVIYEPKVEPVPLERFRISLRPTKYAMMGQVVIEDAFVKMVCEHSQDCLNVSPSFNSNGTIFWYYED